MQRAMATSRHVAFNILIFLYVQASRPLVPSELSLYGRPHRIMATFHIVEFRTLQGDAPIHLAAARGRAAIVQFLIAHKASRGREGSCS